MTRLPLWVRPLRALSTCVFAACVLAACEERRPPPDAAPRTDVTRAELRPPTDSTADLALGQVTLNLATRNLTDAIGLFAPGETKVDSAGRVWVADTNNHRVLAWNNATTFSNGTPAALVLGQPDAFNSACNSGGSPSATSLCSPRAIAIDAALNVFVADTGNNRVLQYNNPFTSDVVADRVLGQATMNGNACPSTPSASTLCSPGGVALDSAGNLWVSDGAKHRVLKFNTPLTTDLVADLVVGQPGFTSGAINRVDGRGLFDPRYVAIDKSVSPNRILVSDVGNHRVLGWPNATAFTNGAAATLVIGQADFSGSLCNGGGTVSATTLCSPAGLAVDASGTLFVADKGNNRVLAYLNPFGTDAIADKVWGQATMTTATCAGASATSLCGPDSIAFSPPSTPASTGAAPDLYVSDTAYNRVLRYFSAYAGDTTADQVFGQAGSFTSGVSNSGGRSASSLYAPKGLAFTPAGDLFVADYSNGRVLAFKVAPAFDAVADLVYGVIDFITAGANNSESATTMYYPSGLAYDSAGTLWVADSYWHPRVKGYQTALTETTTADLVLGNGSTSLTYLHCSPTSATCIGSHSYTEQGLALDSAGNLYVTDTFGNRVLAFDAPLTANKPASRVLGQLDFSSVTPNGIDVGGFNTPGAVAVDTSVMPNRLWVADTLNNRVLGFASLPGVNGQAADKILGQTADGLTLCGGSAVSTTASTLCNPRAVAVGPTGNVWVTSTNENRVLEYNAPYTGTNDTVADRVLGQTTLTVNGCNAFATASAQTLCAPGGVEVDAAENVFVSDANNNRLLRYNTPITTDTSADAVLGQTLFTQAGPNLVDARGLSDPFAVAIDKTVTPNRVYVADYTNHRVLGWPDVTGFANGDPASLVLGQPDFASVACTTSATGLCNPTAVAVDGAGRLYVSDSGNNRVLIFDSPFTTDLVADKAVGQADFVSTGCATSATQLCSPRGVAVDTAGNLWVSQFSYNRILMFPTPRSAVGQPTATKVYGQLGSFTTSLTNNGGISGSSLYYPQNLAIDETVTPARLWVADHYNYRTLEFDDALNGDTIADRVLGQTSLTTASCSTSQSGQCYPNGVAVDSLGTVYVSFSYYYVTTGSYSRVLRYDNPVGTDTNADAVYGQSNYTSSSCNATGVSSTTVCAPKGLATDSSGALYVADSSNHRVVVYLSNNRPTAAPVVITPAAPDTTATLTCGYTYADADADPQSGTTFSWSKNGTVVAGQSTSTLGAALTTRGEAWACTVRPRDGIDFGPAVTSAAVTIVNSAPVATGPAVSPATAKRGDTLTATYSFADADADAESASVIRWYANSTLLSAYNDSKTVPPNQVSKGQAVYFTLQPSDGTTQGALVQSPPIVIANTAPTAGAVALTPASPSSMSSLTASWTFADADPGDTQAGSEVIWYKKLSGAMTFTAQPAYANLTTVPSPLGAGDSWYFTLRPRDGTDYGPMYTSNTVVVGSTAPTASNLFITPSTAFKTSTLTLNYTFASPDMLPQGVSERRWYRGGVEQVALLNSNTVAPSNLAKGQSWTFTVKPCDSMGLCGTVQTSPAVVISNSAPSAATYAITPASPTTTQALVASFTISDADGDAESGSEVRWFKNNVEQVALFNLRTVPDPSTTRGEAWYFTLKPKDGTDFGAVVQSAPVTIQNTAPAATMPVVSPAAPTVSATLSATWTYSDADNDPQVGSQIIWLKNGVQDATLDNALTVPPSKLVKGNTWQFRVSPSDGAALGAQVTSNLVTVVNSPPVASGLAIAPNPPQAGVALTSSYTFGDADGDAQSGSELRWYKNGAEQVAYFNLAMVPGTATVRGDTWYFTVRPRDGVAFGSLSTSPMVTVANSPPSVTGLSVTPAAPRKPDTLRAQYTYRDDDGDPEGASEVHWFKNGQEETALQNLKQVPPASISKGQTWYVTVRPYDGAAYGPVVTSAPVTVLNSAPTASNAAINPASPRTTDALTATYTYADVDADLQQGSELRWYRNGVEQPAYFNQTTVPAGVPLQGQTWHFTVTPKDGVDFGAVLQSTSVIIGSSAPVATTLIITPPNPRGTDALTANYSYSDPDGDAESGTELKWLRGGVEVTTLPPNSRTVPAGTARRGEVWRFTVRPSDGSTFGALQTSPVVTIANSAPTATNPVVTPATPDTTQVLYASYTFADNDGDTETGSEIRWFKNGIEQTALLNYTSVSAALTRKNQVWYYRVRPSDGTDLGAAENSPPVFIANSPPVANAGADQTLTPTAATTRVMLDGSQSADADADVLSYTWKEGTTTLATGIRPQLDLGVGRHDLTLEVSDGDDVSTDTVVIDLPDRKPTVTLSGPPTAPPGTFQLVATATDPLQRPMVFRWTQLSGPPAQLSGDTTATLSVSALGAGTRVFEVTAGAQPGTPSDPQQLTVQTRDVAPWAAVVPSRVVVASGAQVIIDGAASTDPNGAALTFAWSGGGAGLALSDADQPRARGAATADGRFLVQLIVDDGTLQSAPGVAEVLVLDPAVADHPPVANAGPDAVGETGKAVRLDGRSSYDLDGDSLTWSWTRVSGPAGQLTDGDTAQPSFRATSAGTVVLSLEVSDGKSASAQDSVSIDVIDPAQNQRPIARLGADLRLTVGQTAVLDGTRSTDADGDALTYLWSTVAGPEASLDDVAAGRPVLSATRAGFHRLQLVVSDGKASSAPVTMLVQVTAAGNTPPLANAGADQRVLIGMAVSLDGSASSDAEGDTLRFVWEQLTGSPAVLTASGAGVTFKPAGVGSYRFRLTVWDREAPSAADEVEIIVATHGGENQAPVAVAGSDQTVKNNTAVKLDGSGSSDADPLDKLTYAWRFVALPTGSDPQLDNRRIAQPSFTPSTPGSYTLELVVSDGELSSSPAYVTVYVDVTPQQPVPCGCGSGDTAPWPLAVMLALLLVARRRPAQRALVVLFAGLVLALAPSGADAAAKKKPAAKKVAPAAKPKPLPEPEAPATFEIRSDAPVEKSLAPAEPAKSGGNVYLDEARQMFANFELEGIVPRLQQALAVKGVTDEQKIDIYKLMGFTHASFEDGPRAEEAFAKLLEIRPSYELQGASPKIRSYFANAQRLFRERQAVKLAHTPPRAAAAGVTTTVDVQAAAGADRVAAMMLHYRPEGGTGGFSQLEMARGANGAFSANVPNVFPGPAGRRRIEYFIRARDRAGALLASVGGEAEPMMVEIETVEARGAPIYKSGAFWAVLGVVVAGGVAAGVGVPLALRKDAVPPQGSLGTEQLK